MFIITAPILSVAAFPSQPTSSILQRKLNTVQDYTDPNKFIIEVRMFQQLIFHLGPVEILRASFYSQIDLRAITLHNLVT
ncbi:hypothetical protein J6590_048856 [Homalodisca vitripennis]|nr:hypothetical protein J6590_048856 [Homalodisca vitripennis]